MDAQQISAATQLGIQINMKNTDASKSSKNKKIAIVLCLIAFIWYIASMFAIWK